MALTLQIALGVVGGAVCIYFLWTGLKETLEDRAIAAGLEKMRKLGYTAGKAGMPPDFYKEELGDRVDVADELAIMQGWDRGWEEFLAQKKKT